MYSEHHIQPHAPHLQRVATHQPYPYAPIPDASTQFFVPVLGPMVSSQSEERSFSAPALSPLFSDPFLWHPASFSLRDVPTPIFPSASIPQYSTIPNHLPNHVSFPHNAMHAGAAAVGTFSAQIAPTQQPPPPKSTPRRQPPPLALRYHPSVRSRLTRRGPPRPTVTTSSSPLSTTAPRRTSRPGPAHRCPECAKEFNRGQDVARHVREVHNRIPGAWACCGLPVDFAARTHSRTYNGVEVAGGCGLDCSRKAALARHLQRSAGCVGDVRGWWLIGNQVGAR
ncbi:uncharacterized protein BXZ73DRAFT_98573 [Epithele typhae]|uniref:uncharacterized protein n=1 Tax=Epithele typhae TaxID=378194 RepID=UPI0020084EC3|nr:uncharacterized protein BXZ73DRAFT_98573 [Epithele typhae]KAH9940743.1 hypothetical protein BXZ73DRAFT_98573 [Epithele typhae]